MGVVYVKGGPGSGNFGHVGRPGEIGGSVGGPAAADTSTIGDTLWHLYAERHGYGADVVAAAAHWDSAEPDRQMTDALDLAAHAADVLTPRELRTLAGKGRTIPDAETIVEWLQAHHPAPRTRPPVFLDAPE